MSIRKRNEFLEGDESDEDVNNGYDSDVAEESKAALRSSKRRKVEPASDDESLDGIVESEEGADTGIAEDFAQLQRQSEQEGIEREGSEEEEVLGDATQRKLKSSIKSSAPKQVAAAQKAAQRSGVVYISRVPPFMKPQTLRHFLAPHASKGIGRVFLTPEDHAAHIRRVKSGGNKKKSFTDGWVEFVSKREAKIAAETLNGNIIGGKKGNFYHDDLWNMKYLKGFKWSHLTEQIANENAERAARMREEVRKTRKENKAFVEDIERGKMLEGMENKRKLKREKGLGGGPVAAQKGVRGKEFKQKPAKQAQSGDKPSEQATRMQRMIF
ncbi:RNA-binding ATPase activator esf2 [Vermiconidia calcicola]|uniref:RNA-binding ATPase activator esf2 n=1 Tax=Vermiconidia calcicola TaxID=1690605 RepID=A0ACC3M8I7_9PEZI|nr:RNA-binding ATPase activator esf2 [Vermiconidia calcicola]